MKLLLSSGLCDHSPKEFMASQEKCRHKWRTDKWWGVSWVVVVSKQSWCGSVVKSFNRNKRYTHEGSLFKKHEIYWRVTREWASWWMRDLLMTIWEQQGGREVPVRSHVLLILSGALTKRRTSCHSPCSFDILTTSESRLVFVHNEDWWLCWWASWQTLQWKQDKATQLQLSKDMWGPEQLSLAR